MSLPWRSDRPKNARGSRALVRVTIVAALCALAASRAVGFDSPILFARGARVPEVVEQFAWRVIEERCAYQAYERRQRSFWAYDVAARALDEGRAYSIKIVSDVAWKKTEPSAYIEMTIVADGRLRLIALASSFIDCRLSPMTSAVPWADAPVETTR
jgi:hypothetical protein